MRRWPRAVAGGAADRAALVALYNATDGPNWRNNTNWLSTKNLSTWYGVTVSNWEVTGLNLSGNKLSGTIPAELASLSRLRDLWLQNNRLTGPLPPELGNLSHLRKLGLSDNSLTGPLPPEWSKLSNLHYLSLHSNALTGTLPPAWGELANLARMFLHSNDFTGSLPAAWGNLSNLTRLYLNQNIALSGALPRVFVHLNLTDLILGGTQLCIPPDAGFQRWLQGIPNRRVSICLRSDGPQAYLTQATQSLTHPVPLVAGKPALLRVFVATDKNIDVSMPPVRATFYRNGTWVHTADIPRRETTVPRVVDEGSLSASANAEIPSSVVSPGLEMVVEIDPGGPVAPALGIGGRIPETGRMALDVREVPPLYLTLVPLLWEENPDRSILDETGWRWASVRRHPTRFFYWACTRYYPRLARIGASRPEGVTGTGPRHRKPRRPRPRLVERPPARRGSDALSNRFLRRILRSLTSSLRLGKYLVL